MHEMRGWTKTQTWDEWVREMVKDKQTDREGEQGKRGEAAAEYESKHSKVFWFLPQAFATSQYLQGYVLSLML